jgi:Arc/MetJ family transcription regulator
MKNITLAIDDEVLDKVRIVAAHKRTTVNAMVRNYLAEVAGRDEKQAEARKQLLHLMETSKGRMAPGWKFDREETHER